jgi:hypothetical protein
LNPNNFTGNDISNGERLVYREPLPSGHEERREEIISCAGGIYRFNLLSGLYPF